MSRCLDLLEYSQNSYLYVNINNMISDTLQQICKALERNTFVKTVSLKASKDRVTDFNTIINYALKRNLTSELGLYHHDESYVDFQFVSHCIKGNKSVKSISIDIDHIDDETAGSISDIISDSNIKELNIIHAGYYESVQISDLGWLRLVNAINGSKVHTVTGLRDVCLCKDTDSLIPIPSHLIRSKSARK